MSAHPTHPIVVLRHSRKSPAPRDMHLSEEGRTLARETGEKFLRGYEFTSVVTTPHFRTSETAALMCEGAGDTRVAKHVIVDTLGDYSWHGKDGEIKVWDLAQAVKETPEAVERRVNALTDAIRQLQNLAHEGPVLVVGHLLVTELLVYAVSGEVLAPLKECEGAVIVFNETDTANVVEIRRR